jgi:leucyl-tRNA synthetase
MSKKYYVVDMFPYPSGNGLHIGHAVGYIATDVYARLMKNLGYDVLHPMGFDSFGLPTEHYALSVGKSCEEVTETNIAKFKEQMKILELDLDLDCEIRTSDPEYYKWTQWIFTLLYNSWFNHETNKAESIETYWGKDPDSVRLAYKATYTANWCEELKTTLSDDEVVDGKSKRGGYPITQRKIPSWFLRITPYTERLIEGLSSVKWDNKKVQSNWIKNRLHDVTFSRQRKWGEPIPIEGETDTMPSIAGSNWYFFRYLDPANADEFCSKEQQYHWMPVDLYVGGSEHNTGHLLYARFITKVLYDLGHSLVDEPFIEVRNVGLMMGTDGQKMSKSVGNVVSPEAMITAHGIDAFRMGICFLGRFKDVKNWNEGSIKGCKKFLQKLETAITGAQDIEDPVQDKLVEGMKSKIEADIRDFSFNTAVSKYMSCFAALKKQPILSKKALLVFLEALQPFAPSFCRRNSETLSAM